MSDGLLYWRSFIFFNLWVKVRVRVRMHSGGVCTVSGARSIAGGAGWLLLQLLILFYYFLEGSRLLSLRECYCLRLPRRGSMHFLLVE